MSRILVAGVGPIPAEAPGRLYAPGLRAWIFAETLARASHNVELATLQFGPQATDSVAHFRLEPGADGAFQILRQPQINGAKPEEALARIASSFSPQAVVALTDVMGQAVARARIGAPVWFDFLGAPMAERQQQAAVAGHDGGLAAAWRTILPCLLSGDRFSACSQAQRLALIGELGACGRLNRRTAGTDLAHVIPMGTAFHEFRKTKTAIRGPVAPANSIILLWAGGFNTWTDVQTLHAGIVEAIRRRSDLRFVSFGGAIPGHCETVYPHFERLVAEGPFPDHFHLMGWADPETVQNAYLEADMAINIDCFSYEGLLGTRSRLLEWMRAGLPIVTTELCELSRILARREMAYSFPMGDAQALGAVVAGAAADPQGRRERARRAAAFLDAEYANERLLAPLLAWAANPQRAPDIDPAAPHCRTAPFPRPDNSLAAAQMDLLQSTSAIEELEALRAADGQRRAALARLQGSRLVRLFARWKGYPLEDA